MARENIEAINRGEIYPDHLQSDFIGPPRDFFESMRSLRKDARFTDFAERKEIEFPMRVGQKLGYLPKWYWNLKREMGKI